MTAGVVALRDGLVLSVETGDGERTLVALGETSLELSDPTLSFEAWTEIGRRLGAIDRASRWWLGDWLNFGEAVYGEDAAQGVDDLGSRYDLALRVTGLDSGTLMNIRSICGRVARPRRRPELGFWTHAEVAALEPPAQEEWLGRAIEGRWNRAELRQALRGRGDAGREPDATFTMAAERVEAAAREVWREGTVREDVAVVPIEAWRRLGAALGEEC